MPWCPISIINYGACKQDLLPVIGLLVIAFVLLNLFERTYLFIFTVNNLTNAHTLNRYILIKCILVRYFLLQNVYEVEIVKCKCLEFYRR